VIPISEEFGYVPPSKQQDEKGAEIELHPLRHDPIILALESAPRFKDGSIPWTKEEIEAAAVEAEELSKIWSDSK